MRQIRQYNQSGEVFACDLKSMTMSDMLHHSERDEPLENYELDSTMDISDIEKSHVIRD